MTPKYSHIFTDGLDKLLSLSVWFADYGGNRAIAYYTDNKLKGYILTSDAEKFARRGITFFRNKKNVKDLLIEANERQIEVEKFHQEVLQLDKRSDSVNMFERSVHLLRRAYAVYFKSEEFFTTNLDPSKDKKIIEAVGRHRLHYIKANILATKDLYRIATHITQALGLTNRRAQFLTWREIIGLAQKSIARVNIAPREKHFFIRKNRLGNLEYFYGDEAKSMYDLVIPSSKHEGNVLTGSGASIGVVTGKVYMLSLADSDLVKAIHGMPKGAILVAESTQPDLVMACHKAAAIVTDEGGVLSHAAIISRELHIPCVVGTKCATEVLKNGQSVTVDGNLGVVTIH